MFQTIFFDNIFDKVRFQVAPTQETTKGRGSDSCITSSGKEMVLHIIWILLGSSSDLLSAGIFVDFLV